MSLEWCWNVIKALHGYLKIVCVPSGGGRTIDRSFSVPFDILLSSCHTRKKNSHIMPS